MKKLLSGILSLVMLLSMLTAALAAPVTLKDAGVILNVPDGMTATDASTEKGYLLNIAVDGNEALFYAFILTYVEQLEGKQLKDLSDEEGNELVQSLAEGMENPSYTAVDRDGFPILVVENENATLSHLVSMVDGWVYDVVIGKTDGVSLTEDEINVGVGMLTSIEAADEVADEAAE